MTSLITYGRVLALVTVCSFLAGLAYLWQSQSSLTLEPRVKHPAAPALSADAVIAVGDLHGDLEQGKTALRLAGLINVYDSWIGGTATLVQTGDLLDRGPNSLSLVDLFESLKAKASKAGGAVHTLLGNHEAMNLLGDFRYVNPAELEALGFQQEPKPSTLVAARNAGIAAWKRRMRKGSNVGIVLRRRPAAVVLGQSLCKTLFIHAGLPLQLLLSVTQSLTRAEPNDILTRLNEIVADAVQSCSEGHCSKDQLNLLSDSNSPVWYRGYVQNYEAEICPEVQQVVQALQVQRIVSGHNIMQDGKIKTLCEGRLNLIDVGMSKAYFGNMAVWQCSNDSLAAIHPERTYRLKLPPQVPA